MIKIPVSFQYQGSHYTGTLDEVVGGGDGMWQLMVKGFFWGRLRRVNGEWFFDESKWKIEQRWKDHFAAVVTAGISSLA